MTHSLTFTMNLTTWQHGNIEGFIEMLHTGYWALDVCKPSKIKSWQKQNCCGLEPDTASSRLMGSRPQLVLHTEVNDALSSALLLGVTFISDLSGTAFIRRQRKMFFPITSVVTCTTLNPLGSGIDIHTFRSQPSRRCNESRKPLSAWLANADLTITRLHLFASSTDFQYGTGLSSSCGWWCTMPTSVSVRTT